MRVRRLALVVTAVVLGALQDRELHLRRHNTHAHQSYNDVTVVWAFRQARHDLFSLKLTYYMYFIRRPKSAHKCLQAFSPLLPKPPSPLPTLPIQPLNKSRNHSGGDSDTNKALDASLALVMYTYSCCREQSEIEAQP